MICGFDAFTGLHKGTKEHKSDVYLCFIYTGSNKRDIIKLDIFILNGYVKGAETMGKWKKVACALASALALCLSLSVAAAEIYSGYATQNLNVRVTPGGEGKIVAHLKENDEVRVKGEEQVKGKSWLLVEVQQNGENVEGYVLGSGIERSVTLQVYEGTYSLSELNTGAWKTAQAGETNAAPQSGTATVIYEGYGVYSGTFSKGKRSGQGTFLWENGESYVGEWKDDQITGKGVLTQSNQTVQSGTFRKGKLYTGIVSIPQDDGGILLRTLSEGELRTSASLTWPDGTTVEGKISKKTGTFTGNVTISYPNGDIYEGELSGNLKSGKGTYTWANGSNLWSVGTGAHYTGEWINDQMEGSGTYYFGKTEKNNYIKGQFSANAPLGTITYVSSAGIRYDTTWKDGKCTSIKVKR